MDITNLGDFEDYEETKNCFLDGRYFNAVLGGIEGVSTTCVKVIINDRMRTATWAGIFNKDVVNFIRVVIETPNMKHAALLVVDFPRREVIFWNPISSKKTRDMNNLANIISKLVKELMSNIGEFKVFYETYNVIPLDSTPKCPMRGYCNAYVIKYVIDYMDDVDYNGDDIMRFAAAIEDKYSHLLKGNTVEEEYFWGGGLGLGLLGGVALGSALSRPAYGYGYPPPAYGYGYGYPRYGYYY